MTTCFSHLPKYLLLSLCLGVGLVAATADETAPARQPTVFMIGDSTMADKPLTPAQPERGWGQLFPIYLKDSVRVVNLAANGRSTKSFRAEGRWQPVMENLKPGDYVIIEFGHNDEKKDKPAVYADAFGAFKQNLERYVRETREKGGKPILATPLARRAFTNETVLVDTHGDYAVAARQVAAEQKVPLLDLEKRSSELLKQLGPEPSKKMFMWVAPGEYATLPKGREDNTHFNAYGACRVCDLAVEEIKTNVPDLVALLRSEKKPATTTGREAGSQP